MYVAELQMNTWPSFIQDFCGHASNEGNPMNFRMLSLQAIGYMCDEVDIQQLS